jgi:hypothetical protein
MIRRMSFDMLKAACIVYEREKSRSKRSSKKEINRTASGDAELRIMDIIQGSGPDILGRIKQDLRFLNPPKDMIDSIEVLATTAKTPEAQTYWTCCLAELVKLFQKHCCETVSLTLEMVRI